MSKSIEKQQELGYSAWQQEPLTAHEIEQLQEHYSPPEKDEWLRMRRILAEAEDVQVELLEWRKCAIYELIGNNKVKFKRWNQSALNRCRKRFLERPTKNKEQTK